MSEVHPWERDDVQFPRLLCEIVSTDALAARHTEELCISMGPVPSRAGQAARARPHRLGESEGGADVTPLDDAIELVPGDEAHNLIVAAYLGLQSRRPPGLPAAGPGAPLRARVGGHRSQPEEVRMDWPAPSKTPTMALARGGRDHGARRADRPGAEHGRQRRAGRRDHDRHEQRQDRGARRAGLRPRATTRPCAIGFAGTPIRA